MTEVLQPLAAPTATPTTTRPHRTAVAAQSHEPSFTELVYAHFAWWRELRNGGPGDAAAAYHELLGRFERRHGRLVHSFWCTHLESAVALTEKPAGRFPWQRSKWSFHRESDWATKGRHEIAAELHRCDELAVRARTVLTGVRQRICLQLVTASAAHLLSLVDESTAHADHENASVLKSETEALDQTEAYYRQAANGQAQIVYFAGMATVAAVDLRGRRHRARLRLDERRRGADRGGDRRGRQRRPADQRGAVRARLRRRPAVRVLPRRPSPADRRRLCSRDHLRLHERAPAPPDLGEGPGVRPQARRVRRRLPGRLQRALGAGHADDGAARRSPVPHRPRLRRRRKRLTSGGTAAGELPCAREGCGRPDGLRLARAARRRARVLRRHPRRTADRARAPRGSRRALPAARDRGLVAAERDHRGDARRARAGARAARSSPG